VRKRVFEIALAELEIARSEAKVDGLANSLVDDPLHNRLKKLLLSKEGKDLVREFMGGQGGGFDDIVSQYFEKAKNGRLRVREDFEETLEQLLDSIQPVEATKAAGTECAALGIKFVALTDGERLRFDIPKPAGIKITEVAEGGAAARAKLQKDDVLVDLGSKQLTPENVDDVMASLKAGDTVVTYFRNRAKASARLTIDQRRPK
jgi:C-terminal processing protease CtpA/Prc